MGKWVYVIYDLETWQAMEAFTEERKCIERYKKVYEVAGEFGWVALSFKDWWEALERMGALAMFPNHK